MKLFDCVDGMYDFDDDFLDEDCFGVTLECELFGEMATTQHLSDSDSESEADDSISLNDHVTSRRVNVSKSNHDQAGSKLKQHLIARRLFLASKGLIPAAATRRLPQAKHYIYHSFGKSDSSMFLPSRLVKHFNSGNMTSVSRLIQLHLDKNCKIDVDSVRCRNMSPKSLVKWYMFTQERHADSIMCVRQTTVTDNTVRSVIYVKFTDNAALDASVRQNIQDPALKRMVAFEAPAERHHQFRREDYSVEEFARLQAIASAEGDKVIYMTVEMTLVTDEASRKVTFFKTVSRVTSMAMAPPPVMDGSLDIEP